MTFRQSIVTGLVLWLGCVASMTLILVPKSGAADLSNFKAGRIIDDQVLYSSGGISTGEIQAFLNAKVPTCDTNGTQPYGGTTRAAYGSSRGYPPPYTCLKDFVQSVPSRNGDSYCSSFPAMTKTAAELIYIVGQNCGVNPRALIVLLQKEQGLITDDWPWSVQYRSATGYGCPDTAPCDAEYYGFFNQLYNAARQFKRYAALNDEYNYQAYRNNFIQWSPNSSCGGSTVYIENLATSALYNYTPYRPNQAALNAGYGTGDGCSAYGNRNFCLYFNDWFGSTYGYTALDPAYGGARWMVADEDTQKFIPGLGDTTVPTSDPPIEQGTQLKFVDKIFAKGKWYLRTEHDAANNLYKGIPQDAIADIESIPFDEPRYMMLKNDAHKFNPRTMLASSSHVFSKGAVIKFTSKFHINGNWFYQTEFDDINGILGAFWATSVSELAFNPFDQPRPLKIKSGSQLTNLRTGAAVSTFNSDTHAGFTDKINVNGNWYYRRESDKSANNPYAVMASNLSEVTPHKIATPYTVVLKHASYKYSFVTGSAMDDQPLSNGQVIRVTQIITINGTSYYRTEVDSTSGAQRGILLSDTNIAELNFITLDNPRSWRTKVNLQKVNLLTGDTVGDTIASDRWIQFATKTEARGQWYLRTQYDTDRNIPYGILLSNLDTGN